MAKKTGGRGGAAGADGGGTGAGDGVSFAERDELLTGADGGKRRRRKKHRWLKRAALGLVLIVVLLVAGVWLFGPALASRYAPGIIASASGESIRGKVEVDKVSLSWSGPQRLEGVRLLDPDGNLVAELNATAGQGLIALATDWKHISGVTLTGKADIVGGPDGRTNLDRAIEPTHPGGSSSPAGGGGAGGKPGQSTLDQLTIDAKIENFAALYRATPDATPMGFTDLDASININRGLVDIDATGVTTEPGAEPLVVKVRGDKFLDASGQLDLPHAEARLTITGAVGDETVESLLRSMVDSKSWDATASAKPDPEDVRGARIFADLKLADGRLTLADPAKPPFIRARVPAALVAPMIAETGKARITRTHDAQLTLRAIDIPITSADFKQCDLRGAKIDGILRIGAIAGYADLGDGEKPVRIEPLELALATDDLATRGIGVKGGTTWGIGSDEGQLAVDIQANGLLDKDGRIKLGEKQPDGSSGEFDTLSAEVLASGVPSSLLRPFIGDPRLSPVEIIGPTANIQARATLSPGGSSSSDEGRPVVATLTAAGSHGSLEAAFNYQTDRISSRAEGLRLQQYNLAPIASAFLDGKAGVGGEGVLLAQVAPFEIPLQGGKPVWPLASFEAEVHVGDLTFTPTQGEVTTPVELKDQGVRLSLKRAGPLELTLTPDKGADGRAVGLSGQLNIVEMFATNPAGKPFALDKAKVTGQISAETLPTDLLSLALSPENLRLAREALGATMSVAVRANGASAGAQGELATIDLSSASGQSLSTRIKAEATRWAIGPTTGTLRISPAVFSLADDRFGISTQAHEALAADAPPTRLALNAPAEFEVSAQPIGWALGEGGLPRMKTDAEGNSSPDLVGSQQAMLTARSVEISGIPNPLRKDDNAPGVISLGLRDLVIGHASHPNAPFDDENSLRAVVYNPAAPASPLMTLDAKVRDKSNAVPLEVAITGADTPAIERLVGRAGLLEGAVGSPVSLTATKETLTDRGIEVISASVDAPRLKGASITFAGADNPARIGLARPANIEWTPTNAWLTENFFSGDGGTAAVKVDGDVRMKLSVDRLTISRAEGDGPMLPGVFDIAARVSTDSLVLITGNGARETLKNVFASLTTGDAPGSVKAAFGADGAQGAKALEGAATISDIADARGQFTTDRARITGAITGSAPTAVIDAMLNQKGLLVDTLGPTSTIDVAAQSLSRTAGHLVNKFNSDYATVDLAGSIQDGVFVCEGDPKVELRIITEAASRRIFKTVLPVINSFEKSAKDTPGLVTATGLRIPLDGDMRKLNGVLRCDLGTAQFKTASVLAPFMKAIKAREAGQIGQKVPVFDIRLENGVARYDEVSLPIGDVTMRTYGKISFVNRKVEIVVMIPFASVSDDLAATVGRLPFVGDVAVVPIKIVGDMDSPRAEFDPELLVKNVIEKNPINSLLDQLGGGDKKDDKKDKPKKKDN